MTSRIIMWLDHWLFKLLPPEIYLRLHGIKRYSEPPTTVTVTYILHGEEKQRSVEFGGAWAAVQMLPLWLDWGFVEPEGRERYFIPTHNTHRLEWYNPVSEDQFVIDMESRPENWAWSDWANRTLADKRTLNGPRPKAGTGR